MERTPRKPYGLWILRARALRLQALERRYAELGSVHGEALMLARPFLVHRRARLRHDPSIDRGNTGQLANVTRLSRALIGTRMRALPLVALPGFERSIMPCFTNAGRFMPRFPAMQEQRPLVQARFDPLRSSGSVDQSRAPFCAVRLISHKACALTQWRTLAPRAQRGDGDGRANVREP
jgi:hypothetical protein